ncbi:MAG: NAD(P)-dependent oxidoreductase, partial [Candidatus Margulisiibacteriota bacterium]
NNVIMTDLPEMDVTDKKKVFSLVERYKPEFVLHLAAETDVDKCETEIDHAFRSNTIGTQNVALACQKTGAVMIYISTGGIFNGAMGKVHTEFDVPDPQNVYSRSKYQGELIVKDLLNEFFIFRAGWMIGGGPGKDRKFVGKIIEFCRTKDTIEAVNDKYGSPTFARDFLSGIKETIKTGEYGLYHMVNSGGSCTRFDIAVEISRILKKNIVVKPVTSERFPLPAKRADSEAMKNYKLELMGRNIMPDWKKSLSEYVVEFLAK